MAVMSLSGISIRNNLGIEFIKETDRVGRIVGFHELPAMKNGTVKIEYPHPELAGFGQVFAWIDVTGVWNASLKGSIKVNGTTIEVTLSKSANGNGSGGSFIPNTKLYYGVR